MYGSVHVRSYKMTARDPNERATSDLKLESDYPPRPYPELMGEGYGSYDVLDLHLPDWYTGRHALLVYKNEDFRERIEDWSKEWPSKLALGKYKAELMWCDCCGLHAVGVEPGNASDLGIPFHEWHHMGSRTEIHAHNLDTLGQLAVCFAVWCHYLNGLEVIFRKENGYKD